MRFLLVLLFCITPVLAKKNILFIAGNPSHGNGAHEFRAGCMLLAKALNESGLDVSAKVHYYGWPKDESIFDGVDACVIYADAGGRFGEKYAFLDKKVKAGMGIMFMHYGVHPSKSVGQKYFTPWIGGYMETGWSVNPHWIADITPKAGHPVGNGVTPGFKSFDEYYWNMRFPTKQECDCCHALATSVPTPEKIVRYINLWNEHGERTMGTKQALMWCRDPQTGGRGVGFVGGHYHRNWAINDFRKLVLNSIVWLARSEVPKGGVPSKDITQAQLNENLDRPVKGKPVLLPTEALLTQKPMKMPNLKKKKKAAKKQKNKKFAPTKVLAQSPVLRGSDKKRIHQLSADVKGLAQIELYASDLGSESHDWFNWIKPTFHDAKGRSIPVEKKHIASNKQAWGELGQNKNAEGKDMRVAGKVISRGFGSHAKSSLTLNVPKGAVKFTCSVALDDGGALRDGKPTPAAIQCIIRTPKDPNAPWEPSQLPRNVDLDYFVVPEGLEVTRWAGSPHLFNPTNMDFDHKGRLWVAEGVNYRRHNGRRPGGDRIAVLEDTDGDGKCDKSHTFVQDKELVAPLGVAVFDNVVVVSQPPHIIVYTDNNRDLKFDPEVDKREILLTGFNAANHDHSLHSITAGPDGKWYFNNGNCGAIFTDKSGKTFRMGGTYYKSGGGDWFVDHRKVSGQKSDDGFVWTSGFSVRMNPDGTNAEIIGHGYRNSYEHATTSLGDLFQNDNDDPPACRVSYVLEYGCAGYFSRDGKRNWRQEKRPNQDHGRAHWRQDDPGTFDSGDIYGGGSPTGIVFYENGALGKKWDGLLLSAEAGKNVIFGYLPKPKGATWSLDRHDFCTTNPEKQFQGSDFIWRSQKKGRHKNWKGKESPTSFRPSDVAIGPDGAIYISDWFDGRVGGHGDLDDSCSGAIYRIAPKGFKPQVPAVDYSTTAGQITALTSPAINVRYGGFEGLKKGGGASYDPVAKLLSHSNPWVAARAIWLLPYLGEKGIAKCHSLLSDANPQTRITALRALRRAGKNILPHAAKLAKDADSAVRRDAALAMRGITPDKSASILADVAKGYDGKDKNYLESIGLGAENHENAVWKAVLTAYGNPSPDAWSDQLARLTWRLWPSDAVPALKARALSNKLSPEQRSFAVESIAFIQHRSAADAMLELANDKSPVKADAVHWLFKRGTGAWTEFNLMPELKKRGIYDPDKIVVNPVAVPAPEKPKFSVADVMKLKGNAEKGKQALMRCVMCHQVGKTGPAYGPHLQGWGQTQTRDVIARSIIDPNADIAHGYTGYRVILKDGKEVQGLIISDRDPVIVKSTGGATQLIPKKRVKEIKKLNRSLMLSADQLGLQPQDVADIVEYLKGWK
ncbi:MAG: PVC-type heme-binding CxxCH protein [Akkermansiaceae bacterium]